MTTRINTRQMDFGAGPARVENIRAALDEQRTAYRQAPAGSHDEDAAGRNVRDLEALFERATENERIRVRQEGERTAADDARDRDRKAADAAALKEQVHLNFKVGNPTASDEDFERLFPTLRDEHLIQQSRDAINQARQRIRI